MDHLDPIYSRPYFVEMPPLTKSLAHYFDYPVRNEIAQTIPIFYVPKFKHFDECIGYIKRVFYLVRELFEYTDLREQGVSLYILVSEPLRPFFEKYREDCAYPPEKILWTPDYSETFRGTAHKIPMLWHPELRKYKKILHSDTALLWWNPSEHPYPLYKQISERWKSEPFFFIGSDYSKKNVGESQFYKRTQNSIYYQAIADYLNITPAEAKDYCYTYKGVNIRGAFYGLTTSLIKEKNFQKEMSDIVKVVPGDELAYTFYIAQYSVPFAWGQDFFPSAPIRDYVAGTPRKEHPVVSICPGCFPKGNYDKNRFFFKPFMDYCEGVNT